VTLIRWWQMSYQRRLPGHDLIRAPKTVRQLQDFLRNVPGETLIVVRRNKRRYHYARARLTTGVLEPGKTDGLVGEHKSGRNDNAGKIIPVILFE